MSGQDTEGIGGLMQPSNWTDEASALVREMGDFVNRIELSARLNQAADLQGGPADRVFINLETLEGRRYTVLLDRFGLKVVADGRLDQLEPAVEREQPYFETAYALLERLSPAYTGSFGALLIQKLNQVQR